MLTTIQIYSRDLPKWREWCKAKQMTSAELMERIMQECKLKHQRELFLSLPNPSEYRKVLQGVRLQRNYRKK